MAQESQPFIEMLKKFGFDLGLTKVDVERLIDVQRNNIDAIGRSAQITADDAKSLIAKQSELAESAFREMLVLVREFKPTGTAQEVRAKQSELARKAFNATIENTRDIADLIKKSNVDAIKIIGHRTKSSLAGVCASLGTVGNGKTEHPDGCAEKPSSSDLTTRIVSALPFSNNNMGA